MPFDDLRYWPFFAAVMCLYLATRGRARRLLLVVASCVFYAAWDVRFLALLGASTAANWALGLRLEGAAGAARRHWLALAVALNLGFLGFFKYYDFFAGSLCALLGADPGRWVLGVALPVGISFFTFEGIAYVVDIHRREIPAQRSLLDFALFVSFFPHLVAGPIIRPHHFFPQLAEDRLPGREDLQWSLFQVLKGLFKKLVLSDALALHADRYFNGDGGVLPWVGVLSFTLRIFFDFSGYTDIARGCACLLGIRLPENFARPYLARDISEFWRRWHISLSSWLRDYLYIPLGGNRDGWLHRYRNYLVVMGLGGLWHGASWNFLLWGLWHGLWLCVHRAWRDWLPPPAQRWMQQPAGQALGWFATMAVVVAGWVPFRCGTLARTLQVLADLAHPAWPAPGAVPPDFLLILAGLATWYAVDRGGRLEQRLAGGVAWPVFVPACGLVLWATELLMAHGAAVPFIYFRF